MNKQPTYVYWHGNNAIYVQNTMYGASLTPDHVGNGHYECREIEHAHRPVGTRVMVKKVKHDGIVFHYVTTKVDTGYTRQAVVFKDGDRDPYPVTIDNEKYEEI